MEQISLYDFFGKESDPLYILISKIRKNETMNIGEYEVTLNSFGFYEVSSPEIHESKSSLDDCYEFFKKETCDVNFFW